MAAVPTVMGAIPPGLVPGKASRREAQAQSETAGRRPTLAKGALDFMGIISQCARRCGALESFAPVFALLEGKKERVAGTSLERIDASQWTGIGR